MTVVFCFFCKQKTAYEMRISDWSSDVVLFRSAWFGAANVTPSRRLLYPVGRFLMVLSRSVHEIVWALIFVSAVGLGALPGILAVAMRSVGFISKITAEAIDNIDGKPVEAIRAVGDRKRTRQHSHH